MLSDLEARKIAADWHGGQGSALYALCSTGAIVTKPGEGLLDGCTLYPAASECRATMAADGEVVGELLDLIDYVYEHGPRGPVDGWSNLIW